MKQDETGEWECCRDEKVQFCVSRTYSCTYTCTLSHTHTQTHTHPHTHTHTHTLNRPQPPPACISKTKINKSARREKGGVGVLGSEGVLAMVVRRYWEK